MLSRWLSLAATLIFAAVAPALAGPAPQKVLHVAFNTAENGFDPAQLGDNTSLVLTTHLFEGLYGYDPLARPAKLVPVSASSMPEVSADFRTWTIRLKPGIRFPDDPAFKGVPRELVAEDFVYSIKRYADPAVRSPLWGTIEQARFKGLLALRDEAIASKKPFDYDRPIEGLRAIDRHTLQLKVEDPRPRLGLSLIGFSPNAVAREVVEFYGPAIAEHPVGTGPFRLAQWRRSSRIVLARNPHYREDFYDADPGPDDFEGQAILKRLRGKRLPMVDRVEAAIIEAGQPRWLAFLDGSLDQVTVPSEMVAQAMPGGKLAPYLEKLGVQSQVVLSQAVNFVYFNMEDPLVGGYTPDKVALRRAIGLGMDVDREIRIMRGGQAVVAHSPIAANLTGYDPAMRSENGEYSPTKAKALLDVFGYVDRDGDGWRERPDGTPLILEMATETDGNSRQYDELMQRNMKEIGLRIRFKVAQWPENAKAARAGKLMMWSQGYGSTAPDGLAAIERLYGPAAAGANLSRFRLPAMDALYNRLLALPDGPERLQAFHEAKQLAVAYMPEKTTIHRVFSHMTQPWLVGYRPPIFGGRWFHLVDIESARR